jgi:hypothetical protein
MPMSYRPSLFVLGALGLCLTGACQDDQPPPKLFQEAGVWSVVSYDLEGTGSQQDINNANRRDAFMLSFDSHAKVVTTAACIESDGDTVADAPCLLSADTTRWDCRCFGYDFVSEEMLWREFNAGDLPPKVSISEADDPPAPMGGSESGGSEGGGGGGGGDGDTLITVAEIMEVASTYNFRPLPLDVFGSNGDSSRFVFQKRAGSVFDKVFDDPDGRPTCSPCL